MNWADDNGDKLRFVLILSILLKSRALLFNETKKKFCHNGSSFYYDKIKAKKNTFSNTDNKNKHSQSFIITVALHVNYMNLC